MILQALQRSNQPEKFSEGSAHRESVFINVRIMLEKLFIASLENDVDAEMDNRGHTVAYYILKSNT